LGSATFVWLAWLLSRRPAPWKDPAGWSAWIDSVDGTALFDAARTTVTLLAVIGIGGAALVAYRRQDTAERTHDVAFESQQTASKQLDLDSQKYQLDRDRHQLDVHQREDERERELRTRFTTIAEQLGSPNFAVRHAGAYALASLADDWHRFGNDSERQVCVDLLCAQLRSPRLTDAVSSDEQADARQDDEVRRTMLALIHSRRPVETVGEHSWKSCSLDLSGADLSGAKLNEIDLSSANLDDVDLSHAVLVRVDLSDARMTRATLMATEFVQCNMARARLYYAWVAERVRQELPAPEFGGNVLAGADFVQAILHDAQFQRADLVGAKFSGAKLEGADFSGAKLEGAWFYGAKLSGASFRKADLRGAAFARGNDLEQSKADLSGAEFGEAVHDETTKWPDGSLPDQLRTTEGA
jgi:uncharacterized protein YjbI with pentapeptide repeats